MSTSNPTNAIGNQSTQPSSQLVCVKRPENSLNSVFEHMYVNERLVDVTLSCSNGQLQAHKLVLAACSQYFSDLFDRIANPFHYPVVVIKDMKIEDLKLLVEFMYKGQITIDTERLTSFVKSAENLQISGLTSLDSLITNPVDKNDDNLTVTINVEGPRKPTISSPANRAFSRRSKRSANNYLNHGMLVRTYQRSMQNDDELDDRSSSSHLLEQSMTTNDTIDDTNHFSSSTYSLTANTNHIATAKNLITTSNQLNHTSSQHHLHTNSVSSLQHIQHHLGIDSQTNSNTQQHGNQNLSNHLQVLSHSLAANRTTLAVQSGTATMNGQMSTHIPGTTPMSTIRGRLHPCNICWKTFREKANLKRHQQVHSLDRVVYACPDCNKTFSWKDNYIRHTKTAHHMNNVTRQQGT